MCLMTLGPMFGYRDCVAAAVGAQMGSHALTFVQDLHRGRSSAHIHQLMDQGIGHAVEVGVERDVVIDVDSGTRPLAEIEPFQWQWPKRRPVDGCEQRTPRALSFMERSGVEPLQHLPDLAI